MMLRRTNSRPRRGTLAFVLASFIVMAGAALGILLYRSGEAYRNSVQTELRLRALAAAEGAGVALASGFSEPVLTLPGARVHVVPPTAENEAGRRPLHVEVLARNGTVSHEERFVALLESPEGGTSWRFVGLLR